MKSQYFDTNLNVWILQKDGEFVRQSRHKFAGVVIRPAFKTSESVVPVSDAVAMIEQMDDPEKINAFFNPEKDDRVTVKRAAQARLKELIQE